MTSQRQKQAIRLMKCSWSLNQTRSIQGGEGCKDYHHKTINYDKWLRVRRMDPPPPFPSHYVLCWFEHPHASGGCGTHVHNCGNRTRGVCLYLRAPRCRWKLRLLQVNPGVIHKPNRRSRKCWATFISSPQRSCSSSCQRDSSQVRQHFQIFSIHEYKCFLSLNSFL